MKLPNNLRFLTPLAKMVFVLTMLAGAVIAPLVMPSAPAFAETSAPAGPEAVPTVWSSFRYINVAGSILRPRASATEWTYPGGGCISAADGNDIFITHLDISHGSRIDYLRIYYYDTSASNSTAWVTTYNGAGVTTDLISVNSTGAAGYGTALSAYVGHVVDTANNSYVLNWRANQTGSTMSLCGLRIAYRLPLDIQVYLPLIRR